MLSGNLDYELLDFGGGRKLERFGSLILDRPEVLATGSSTLSKQEWAKLTKVAFEESGKGSGSWIGATPSGNWNIEFREGDRIIWKMNLKLAPFKHVGIFPEQVKHWNFLLNHLKDGKKFLNLFAYTGGATLSAAQAGADCYHVDASKSIVNSAAENARLSGIGGIHWVVEDALRFAQKECKRGRKYEALIMDPPVYGRGKKGEHWKLEEKLAELIATAHQLLNPNGIMILNTYSPKISVEDMITLSEKKGLKIEDSGWLTLKDREGRVLNLSKYLIAVRTKVS